MDKELEAILKEKAVEFVRSHFVRVDSQVGLIVENAFLKGAVTAMEYIKKH